MQHQAFQDRDWEFSVYIQNAIGERTDITGSTWAFKLFDAPGGTPVLSAISGGGITLTDAGAGRMDIAFDDSVMTIGPGNYAAELVRTDTGADVYGVWPVVVGLEGQLNGGTGDIVIRPSDAIQLRAVNAPAGPSGVGGGGSLTDGDYGDIIVGGGATSFLIDQGSLGAPLRVLTGAAGTDDVTAVGARTQTAWVTNAIYVIKAPNTNTGTAPVRVNPDGIGFKTVKKNGVDLIAEAWTAGVYYWLLYDGTNLEMIASSAVT